jgi:glycosyltransferase involved in cell wall biosynthesis
MADKGPLVSVLMPVRNGGSYLAAAVESILEQTHRHFELLLINDHSKDDSISKLDNSDARLGIIENPGRGLISALNSGIEAARGEYIARMDSDDLALPHRLKSQLSYLAANPEVDICGGQVENRLKSQLSYLAANPEVDICGGQVEIFRPGKLGAGNQRYQEWLNSVCTPEQIHLRLFIESPIPHPTAMFRRDAIIALGGYLDLGWPEDYDLFLRADAAGLAMGKPGGTVLRWRDHDQRLTRNDSRYDLKRFQAAKAYYLATNRIKKRTAVIWGAGKTGRQMYDLLTAEGVNIAGFIEVHPRRIGGLKRGKPVWPMARVGNLNEELILVAVGAAGAREEIGEWLEAQKKHEGIDYLFVA